MGFGPWRHSFLHDYIADCKAKHAMRYNVHSFLHKINQMYNCVYMRDVSW